MATSIWNLDLVSLQLTSYEYKPEEHKEEASIYRFLFGKLCNLLIWRDSMNDISPNYIGHFSASYLNSFNNL